MFAFLSVQYIESQSHSGERLFLMLDKQPFRWPSAETHLTYGAFSGAPGQFAHDRLVTALSVMRSTEQLSCTNLPSFNDIQQFVFVVRVRDSVCTASDCDGKDRLL